MQAHTKRLIRKVISPIRKFGLKNRDFTIISNNCFGGYVYDFFGLKYLTPTIGLYMMSNDYIKFISNLKFYLNLEVKPLDVKKSKYYSLFQKESNSNPMLGIVGDIEVIFVHYKTVEIACEKWNERKKIVNFNNLIIKYNDQNQFSLKDFDRFNSLNYLNKLFFTANKNFINNDFSFYIKQKASQEYVLDDVKSSKKVINYRRYLNSVRMGN